MKLLFWPTELELQESLQVREEKRDLPLISTRSVFAALNDVTMSRLSCRSGSSCFIATQFWALVCRE
jgi:hypothetical protein